MNYGANEKQVFLTGLCREGWVVRRYSLLWLTLTMGAGQATVMEDTMNKLPAGPGQATLMGEPYFMCCFLAQV